MYLASRNMMQSEYQQVSMGLCLAEGRQGISAYDILTEQNYLPGFIQEADPAWQ